MREIIFDTETTGLDPINDKHKIIEIGGVEMINKVLTGREFRTYINPQRKNDAAAYNIHGISDDFLKDKPLFIDIATEFLEFIKDARLVAHNARFDMRFLNHELMLINKPTIDMDMVTDTLLLARRKFPGAKVSLDALCDRFEIDRQQRQQNGHGALIDARLLAEVYIQLTGGRQTKFDISYDATNKLYNTNIVMIEENITNTAARTIGRIVQSSDIENEMHQQFLTKIKQPLWCNSN